MAGQHLLAQISSPIVANVGDPRACFQRESASVIKQTRVVTRQPKHDDGILFIKKGKKQHLEIHRPATFESTCDAKKEKDSLRVWRIHVTQPLHEFWPRVDTRGSSLSLMSSSRKLSAI